jgi:hypothetical protein
MPGANIEVSDLMLSNATIWLSDTLSEALPADTLAAGASWGGTWYRLGLTGAPLTAAYEYDVVEADVQESLTPVDRAKSAERLICETTLSQIDPDVQVISWGGTVTSTAAGAGQPGKKVLNLGGNNRLKRRKLGIEGDYVDEDGATFPQRIFVYIVTFAMGGTLEFNKAGYMGTTIRIAALADMSRTKGDRLLNWTKILEPATS